MERIRWMKRSYSVLAVILIAVGAFLLVKPQTGFIVICRILGVLLAAYGIIKIAGYFTKDRYELAFQFDLAMGILSMVLGCILIFRAPRMLEVFPAFIGVVVLTDAVFKIQTSLDARRFGIEKWWIILLIAIVAGMAGLLLLSLPIDAVSVLMRLTGINLVIDGCLNLWVVHDTVRIVDRKLRRG